MRLQRGRYVKHRIVIKVTLLLKTGVIGTVLHITYKQRCLTLIDILYIDLGSGRIGLKQHGAHT